MGRKKKKNLELIEEVNRGTILKIIRDSSPISRSEVRRLTSLNLVTVSNGVKYLLRKNFIREVGIGKSKGGRRPLLFEFNPDAGVVIGINLEEDRYLVTLANLCLKILSQTQGKLMSKKGPEHNINQIIVSIRKLIDKYLPNKESVLGIGASSVGWVDSNKGILIESTNLGWRNVPLKSLFEQNLRVPVFVEEDLTVIGLGEWQLIQNRKLKNFIYIYLGIGIGASIIINGKVYRGSDFGAGELGHCCVRLDGPACKCGNKGCLEAIVGERALVGRTIEAISRGVDTVIRDMIKGDESQITVSVIEESAKRNDKFAYELLSEASRYLGLAIGNLINILDPEMVVIGGSQVENSDFYFEMIRSEIQKRIFRGFLNKITIRKSSLNQKNAAIGAAALAVNSALNFPVITWE